MTTQASIRSHVRTRRIEMAGERCQIGTMGEDFAELRGYILDSPRQTADNTAPLIIPR